MFKKGLFLCILNLNGIFKRRLVDANTIIIVKWCGCCWVVMVPPLTLFCCHSVGLTAALDQCNIGNHGWILTAQFIYIPILKRLKATMSTLYHQASSCDSHIERLGIRKFPVFWTVNLENAMLMAFSKFHTRKLKRHKSTSAERRLSFFQPINVAWC